MSLIWFVCLQVNIKNKYNIKRGNILYDENPLHYATHNILDSDIL